MINHIHIFGASGSGTSTLGEALARAYGHTHLDTDDYFWEATNPPYQRSRERAERQALLAAAVDAHPRWVLSGSLCGWGDVFIARFDLVVFLVVPQEIRLARLRVRELNRYGEAALAPGGTMYERHRAFMKWAADYDNGDETMRSRIYHERWLAGLPCPCIRFEGVLSIEEQLSRLRTKFFNEQGDGS